MKNDGLRHLPPPPLFIIRPPPKPPGPLFEHFQTVEIFNGRCIRPSLNILNSSSTILQKHEEQTNWINLFLLILAIISVVSCIIIAIFIFICLKKLKKEEKQYKSYVMTGSHPHHHSDLCTRLSEHYKCTSNTFNCCDDYYSHQLIPVAEVPLSSVVSDSTNTAESSSIVNNVDGSQNHQYECIPEYLLTMTRHRHPPVVCHHQYPLYHPSNNTCSVPYATFSRSLLLSRGATTASTSDSSQCTCSPPHLPLPSSSTPTTATVVQEESSTPLLASSRYKESHQKREETKISSPKSMMIGWTRRKGTNAHGNEQRRSFLSQLRNSSVVQ